VVFSVLGFESLVLGLADTVLPLLERVVDAFDDLRGL